MQRYVFISALAFAVAALLVGGFFLSRSARRALPPDIATASFETLSRYWKAEIAKEGAQSAYLAARPLEKGLPADASHRFGHLIGDLLYDAEGEHAMQICDTSFLYGCYHQVVARALKEFGTGHIKALAAQCPLDKDGQPDFGCIHGIGHGLMAHFGYTDEGLALALKYCPPIHPAYAFFGCEQGAFMEYDFNTMSTKIPRRFDPHAPAALCALSPADKGVCLFTTAHWWEHSAQSDAHPQTVRPIGALCIQNSRTPAERIACFAGIGYGVPDLARFDPTRIGQLCASASDRRSDQVVCTICAASTMAGIDERTLPAICHGLDSAAEKLCVQNSCNPASLGTVRH